ncbi:MAG TPA: HAD family phosphatase [Tepidisphaeraceae bacterium]|jgi:HAD superfamily hydrolase (TIGR01509 family)
MPSGLRAVLFDFDGVIVNSEPLHYLAFHEVLRAEKVDLTEQEYYREMIGFDDKGAFKRIYEMRGIALEPKVFLRLLTRKSEVMMELIRQRKHEALPGAAEFIRSLWREYPLAICSGALREEIEIMLEGISLRDCFKTIVSAEDVTRGKPDPQGYLLTVAKLSQMAHRELRPSECLVVEDAPTVIRSVKEAGFPTLGVATTYPVEKLSDADYAVASLDPMTVKRKIPGLKMML